MGDVDLIDSDLHRIPYENPHQHRVQHLQAPARIAEMIVSHFGV